MIQLHKKAHRHFFCKFGPLLRKIELSALVLYKQGSYLLTGSDQSISMNLHSSGCEGDCLTFAWIAQFPLVFQATGAGQRDSRANFNGFQKKIINFHRMTDEKIEKFENLKKWSFFYLPNRRFSAQKNRLFENFRDFWKCSSFGIFWKWFRIKN